MAKIIIKIPKGTYSNADAINKLIGYIATDNHQLALIGGFGFFPITADSAIEEFNKIDSKMSKYSSCSKKVYHLIMALDNTFRMSQAVMFANYIASTYASNGFFVFYGIHDPMNTKEHRGVHIHFCIQYYSYNCYRRNLSPDFFMDILEFCKHHLIQCMGYTFKTEVGNNA